MDVVRFDTLLGLALGDPAGAVYSSDLRTAGMSGAVRLYTRFRAFKRRYGTGHIYADAASGQKIVFAVGGPFAAGASITLDFGTGWAETAVINTVTRPAPEDNLVSTAVKLTMVSNLAQIHYAGGLISQTSLGLPVVAGTDTYVLPFDFIEPETDSWDRATGAKRFVKRKQSFYDAVYEMSERIGGVGFGQSQGFRGGTGIGPGFTGIVASPSGALRPPVSSDDVVYEFIDGSPPTLQISPVPAVSQTLDFYYIAQHLPANIPDSAVDALLIAAQAWAIRARIAKLGQGMDWKDGEASQSRSSVIKALADEAKDLDLRFDDYVRCFPILVTG